MIFKNIFFILSAIFIDQFSKYIIRSYGGFYICNQGISFGMPLPQILIFFISMAVIVFLLFLILNFKFNSLWRINYALLLVVSGAISNLLDRLRLGCVVDFISLLSCPVFNLADAFIVIGGIISAGQLLNLKKYYGFQNIIRRNHWFKK